MVQIGSKEWEEHKRELRRLKKRLETLLVDVENELTWCVNL